MNEIEKDIEILNVNNELIKSEKPNGFKIKNNNLIMFVKKIPSNLYKLGVLLLATVADIVPNIVSKVPVVGYAFDAIKAAGEQHYAQVASDDFFDNVICPMFGITVDFNSPDYAIPFANYTHHEGKYYKISLLIKTISQFAMEHPGLVLAGGAAIVGLAYKAIAAIVKGVKRKHDFNKMNDKQKDIYLLLKDILKSSRKIKKADNGKVLVKDLNITYDIVNYLGEYADMLDKIQNILQRLQSAIKSKNEVEYEKCRLDLETSVFAFDRNHDNILNKQMHLEEDSKGLKNKK